MARILVVGSLSLDRNQIEDREDRKLGGASTYGGLTAARLGLDATAVTCLAAADRAAIPRLERQGLQVRCRFGRSSTRFVNRTVNGHRSQRVESLAEPIRAADIPDDPGGWIVRGALHPDDVEERVLDRLAMLPLASDIQGFVRRIEDGRVRAAASDRLGRVLERSRIVKADDDEIAVAAAALGCDEADLARRFGIEELIVTRADRGGRVHRLGQPTFAYDAVPVRRIEDPTGAGDVFLAAYLTARMGDRSPQEAARFAAEISARQVAGDWLDAAMLALDPA